MKIGEKKMIEVATGGDPVAALSAGVVPYSTPGHVMSVGVGHDEGCPCTAAEKPMTQCTCEIVEVTISRVA